MTVCVSLVTILGNFDLTGDFKVLTTPIISSVSQLLENKAGYYISIRNGNKVEIDLRQVYIYILI